MAFELNHQERALMRDNSFLMNLVPWILASNTRVAAGVRKHLRVSQQAFPTPTEHAKVVRFVQNLRANDYPLAAWLVQEYHDHP